LSVSHNITTVITKVEVAYAQRAVQCTTVQYGTSQHSTASHNHAHSHTDTQTVTHTNTHTVTHTDTLTVTVTVTVTVTWYRKIL
jgi:hypothetical protein